MVFRCQEQGPRTRRLSGNRSSSCIEPAGAPRIWPVNSSRARRRSMAGSGSRSRWRSTSRHPEQRRARQASAPSPREQAVATGARHPPKGGSLVRSERHDRSKPFEFMMSNQAEFPTETMARSMGVSRSGFYAWQAREPSARDIADRELTNLIRRIQLASRESYGEVLPDLWTGSGAV